MKKSNDDLWTTYRRKMLNYLLYKYKDLYHGNVLDIGGRDRGIFKTLKSNVKRWIFADINEKNNPDIILDVTDMKQIESNSIDVVNAIELFEHVRYIEKGLKECNRVLKENGTIIISTPFLYYIHNMPYDFQRWTYIKWQNELIKFGFELERIIVMGNFFTFLAEMLKSLCNVLFRRKRFFKILFPVLNQISNLDNKSFAKNNPRLKSYHNGYFIVAKKLRYN
jgi:predicted SAM-dependent methyltransferase